MGQYTLRESLVPSSRTVFMSWHDVNFSVPMSKKDKIENELSTLQPLPKREYLIDKHVQVVSANESKQFNDSASGKIISNKLEIGSDGSSK